MNNNDSNKITLSIIYNESIIDEKNFENIYDKENDKLIFDFSKENKNINIFDISEILFNDYTQLNKL